MAAEYGGKGADTAIGLNGKIGPGIDTYKEHYYNIILLSA